MIYQVQSVKRPALVVDMYTVKPLAKGQILETSFGTVRVLGLVEAV